MIRIAIAFAGVGLAFVSAIQPAGAGPVASSLEKAVPAKMDMTASAIYWVQNLNSGKCALSRGNADGMPVVQNQCLNYNDQKWGFIDKGGARYQIFNANSGKCLLVRGSSNEAPAVQNQCLDFVDQYWQFFNYPGHTGWYWLQNVNSQKCLLARGNSDGTQLVQVDCLSFVDQAWGLTEG